MLCCVGCVTSQKIKSHLHHGGSLKSHKYEENYLTAVLLVGEKVTLTKVVQALDTGSTYSDRPYF
jgi:hypothetical protein